jgi:acetyltransferase
LASRAGHALRASGNPSTPNYNLLANLVRVKFKGRLYPVNPNIQEIDGMKAYPSLKSIEDEIDMVVSSVPAAATLDVIKDCIEKKVKVVVIVSGGFSEVGPDGRKVQEEIALLLKRAGIRAIGPNCLSPINTSNNLVIGFDPHEKLHKGSTSIIVQSGFYEPRLEWIFWDLNLGLSKLIDLGNKIDINEVTRNAIEITNRGGRMKLKGGGSFAYLVSVNGKIHRDLSTIIRDGDEIFFFTPLGGG